MTDFEKYILKTHPDPDTLLKNESIYNQMKLLCEGFIKEQLQLGGVSKSLPIVEVLNEYIKLLGEELNDTAQIAAAHGWKSNRIEQGNKLRTKLNDLGNVF